MHIREILKHPKPPKLTTELVSLLTHLCFYDRPIQSASVLFVFGSNILHQKIGHKINHFLETYSFDTVLLTGGIANYKASFFESTAESELLLHYIPTSKFPQINFIIEKQSRNTLENVVYANELFNFSAIQSLSFLSHSYASMRSYLTLKKVCQATNFYNYPIPIPSKQSGPLITQSTWFETAEGQALVWGEYLRFATYGKRGDFPTQEVDTIVDQIQQHLKL